MSTIMKMARTLAGEGKLAIGSTLKQITHAGTEISVINKGKGIFQKIVSKSNGSMFTSTFGNQGELLKVSAKNARGSYIMEYGGVQAKLNDIPGIFNFGYTTTARVPGIEADRKFWGLLGTEKILSDYVVRGKGNISSIRMHKMLKERVNKGYLVAPKEYGPSWSILKNSDAFLKIV